MAKTKSEFTKQWILKTGIPIAETYGGNLTLRGLHYRLVAEGMTNDIAHYKKVVATMIEARWEGLIGFDAFLDHDRETLGETKYEPTNVEDAVSSSKYYIKYWANNYEKNRWENQPNYVEVFIEKKALQGVFEKTCKRWDVALNPCKGYPSLTFLYDAYKRFTEASLKGKNCIILYFGDYDPSGEDIPRSIVENLSRIETGVQVELIRVSLTEAQVVAWKLPPAPAKLTDSRTKNWEGLGQVELDAVMPDKIERMLKVALEEVFDAELYSDLKALEAEELIEYKEILKRDFNSIIE
jgi:hypothetical protein